MKRFSIFVRKEWLHIWRDRRTLVVLICMPIVQIILYGFALTNEVKNCRIAVWDQSNDVATIALTQEIDASRYFEVTRMVHSRKELDAVFREGKIRMAVVFPRGFRSDLLHVNHAQMQLIADASDPNTANTLTSYASAIIADYQQAVNGGQPLPYQVRTEIRMLYNPELKGAYNFVPGVMALILMLVCAMMTSIAIVRERELGMMEVILVSPVQPFAIVVAKTIPYLVVAIVNITSILLLSVYALDVPIRGSLGLLIAESILFSITSLALGILISSLANSQRSAMFFSIMALFLPTLMFSGVLFPVENMPAPLRIFSNIVVAKWFYIIVKAIMIRGMGIEAVWKETLILAGMTLVFLGFSIQQFKIRLV